MNLHFSSFSQIKIGVFADCQYCDCETVGSRYYKNSLDKLEECINQFNRNKELDFIVGLGDLIDRNISSFDSVNVILSDSRNNVYHVIGNHDLAIEESKFDQVPSKLNIKKTWYSIKKKGWKYIFLNGNDITFQSNNGEIVQQANEMTTALKNEGKPNFHEWNGGIGFEQLEWLKKELKSATRKNLRVVIFCHYPLLPLEKHALWNSEQVLEVFTEFNCVKLYMNGHNHSGNYAFQHGIHFVNLKGMVETETENSFSVLSFFNDKIEIEGFGREESRSLQIE